MVSGYVMRATRCVAATKIKIRGVDVSNDSEKPMPVVGALGAGRKKLSTSG
jgi:hypothetical protein